MRPGQATLEIASAISLPAAPAGRGLADLLLGCPFLIPPLMLTNSVTLVKLSIFLGPWYPHLGAGSNDSRHLSAKCRTRAACSGHTALVSRRGTLRIKSEGAKAGGQRAEGVLSHCSQSLPCRLDHSA